MREKVIFYGGERLETWKNIVQETCPKAKCHEVELDKERTKDLGFDCFQFLAELTEKEQETLLVPWREEIDKYGFTGKDDRDATGKPWRWNCCITFHNLTDGRHS